MAGPWVDLPSPESVTCHDCRLLSEQSLEPAVGPHVDVWPITGFISSLDPLDGVLCEATTRCQDHDQERRGTPQL